MSDAIVVDASVVFKWFVPEELSAQAKTLLRDAERSGISVNAPPLVRSETTNALYQRYRRRELTPAAAEQSLAALLAIPLTIIDADAMYSRALSLALQHGFSNTYDCLYAALASLLDVDYWTADRRFVDAFSAISPHVRWIGDYPIPVDTGS